MRNDLNLVLNESRDVARRMSSGREFQRIGPWKEKLLLKRSMRVFGMRYRDPLWVGVNRGDR